jgi:hypothetical protein
MEIFSKQGKISKSDDKTNITLNFIVPDNTTKITIKYSYSPKEVEDKSLASKAIIEGMQKYNVDFADKESFMPVFNLVTLSFDENGEYRGACHRQPNNQTIIIADNNSTPGILNRPIKSGEWDVILNIHYAGCDIDYKIEIDGEVEE